jgi:predicted acetyltransferase
MLEAVCGAGGVVGIWTYRLADWNSEDAGGSGVADRLRVSVASQGLRALGQVTVRAATDAELAAARGRTNGCRFSPLRVVECDVIDLQVAPVGDSDQLILEALLELYWHDLTVYEPAEVGADGRYGWRYLDRWRHSNGWRPFLARVDGLPAGFALVRIQGHVHVLQEFFVLRRHRRNGIGRLLAADVFSQFPGAWLVSLQAANTVAAAFWQDAVSRCGPVDWGRETTAGRCPPFHPRRPVTTDSWTFEVAGSPIGGENPPHDRRWRHQVAAAAAGHGRHRGVRLDFQIEPHRSVDLDNLVRPALAGLRDAASSPGATWTLKRSSPPSPPTTRQVSTSPWSSRQS